MSEVHALVGAYAVDALDDLERTHFERHLAGCQACRDEVDSLQEAAGLLGASTPVPPPPLVRERVLADIRTVRPLPPLTAPREAVRRAPHRLGLLAAAAAVVLTLGAGAVIWQPWDETTQTVSAVDQVLTAPDATRHEATLTTGDMVTLVHSRTLGRAVLLAEDLDPAPTGRVYELWLQTPQGAMVPAGLMPPGADQAFLLDGDASQAIGAGITIEPAGGSEQPTSDPLVLFDLRSGT